MKKIIIIDKNLPYLLNNLNFACGGASVQTMNWLYGFNHLAINPIILSSANVINSSKYIIDKDIIFDNLNLFSIFRVFYFYFKYFKINSPDYIYCSVPYWSNIFYLLPAKILGIKFIQRISNDNLVVYNTQKIFNSNIKSFIYYLSILLTDNIVCQNDYQLINMKRRFPSKNIFKLYNPFLIKNDFQAKTSSKKYVAWIGIFQKQKNLQALLKIVISLPLINFKIAGGEKESKVLDNETIDALSKLSKLDNVNFVGFLDRKKIFSFLSNSYCLLNTSHEEGFSNTYLEAFSKGIPVVTRKKTDPDNIIFKYKLGLAVAYYEELPNALLHIIEEKNNYKIHLKKYLDKYHNPKVLANNMLNQIN